MTPNRPQRVDLTLDGRTGEILHRSDFKDRHWIDRVVGTCIAAHEGQLFGWPNQALGLLTASGLLLLCASGVVLWWRRRDVGTLGAPKPLAAPRFSFGLLAIVLFFAVCLPLFGASLLLVLFVEKTLLSRIPGVREWLGLQSTLNGVEPSPVEAAALKNAALLLLLAITPAWAGCGPQPITGGTPGMLRAGGNPLSEVQVTVHQGDAGVWRFVGFGDTMTDGSFELVTQGAVDSLRLAPGEYRCTLESVGAPVRIPQEYASPETTPLQVSWSQSDEALSLDIPALPLAR